MSNCINSSKVYCKYTSYLPIFNLNRVLIVAKCIVNAVNLKSNGQINYVLIVAKCIVNYYGKAMDGITWFVLIVAKCIVNA